MAVASMSLAVSVDSLVVAGSRNAYIHWAQEMFDQAGMVREVVKWDYELRGSEQLGDVVERAISVATSDPKGPVYLTLPREVLAEGARAMMIEVPPVEAGPGVLVLFRMKPRAIAKHVGILTGPDSFLHAYERLGVIEEPLTPSWRRRIAFAFLFPQR